MGFYKGGIALLPPIGLALLLALVVDVPFAACAVALEEVSLTALRRQAGEGEARAARVVSCLKHPAAFLRGIALWRLLCCGTEAICLWLLAGALPLSLLGRCLSLAGGVLVLYLLTWLIPRRVALNAPLEVLSVLAPVLLLLITVVRPVTGGLAFLVRQGLRLFHIDPDLEREEVSEEEIRLMMDLGEERGAIDAGEKEMIENVFDFKELTAGDVMVHRTDMVLLWVGAEDEEILRTIQETGLSRFPVYDKDADDIVGILSTRSYFLNTREETPRPLRELLRTPYFIPESVTAVKLFRDMQSKKVHMAIVVDEYGGTAGLVTMEDLLEEIVGNIYDEFDPQDEQEIIRLGENQWRVAGSAELDELAQALGIRFPDEEEAETLGGLVFSQLSVIPEDGSRPAVDAYGLHIQVESLRERRVEWALVSQLPQPVGAAGEEN